MNGHVEAAAALHAAGASARALRADGSSALHIAASSSSSPGASARMFSALLQLDISHLLGSKNASGDNIYHLIARQKDLQLLMLAASVTQECIHVIACNEQGRTPLMVALEGQGGTVDGALVAMELVNVSGAFASGVFHVLAPKQSAHSAHSTSLCLVYLSRAAVFEKLRAKNGKSYVFAPQHTVRQSLTSPRSGSFTLPAPTTMGIHLYTSR
jgi:hypothetical protein